MDLVIYGKKGTGNFLLWPLKGDNLDNVVAIELKIFFTVVNSLQCFKQKL